MYKEIVFWILTFIILNIFYNSYYWKSLLFIANVNNTISIANNQIAPYNLLEKDWFDVECLVWNIEETNLNWKINTIVYYTTSPLTFVCDNNFYKWDSWFENLMELENKIKSICYIKNSNKWRYEYFCSNKS